MKKPDHNATLEELQRTALRVQRTASEARRVAETSALLDFIADARRLADLCVWLDGHMHGGGTVPTAWQSPQAGLFGGAQKPAKTRV